MTVRKVKRMNIFYLGSYGLCYVVYFSCLIIWVQFDLSFSALWKTPDVNIFKRLLVPQFSFNVNQTSDKAYNSGEIQVITFSGDLPNFKYMALLREVTSATLAQSMKLY